MDITSNRVPRMGKYSHGFFRRNSATTNASNFQQAGHKLKECTEYRRSVARDYTSQGKREDQSRHEDTLLPAYSSPRTSDECHGHGHESRLNCANILCECRPGRTGCATGKNLIFRGKGRKPRRSKSLAAQNQMSMGLLTRSTSCGDVCYFRYKENDVSHESSSGTDNEQSDVLVTDGYNSSGSCVQCNGEKIMKTSRSIGSLPNLNGIYKENSGNNQLGLEVMLSLINGPFQSVIDSKDEKIRNLERTVERLEGENKQMKYEEKPADAAKILGLERNLENCARHVEQLEEANKTADETIRFLEDLRKNDHKYVDILKAQINDLETKLSESDEQVREADREWTSQSERLKVQHEKRIEELNKTLRSKESKLRDYEKIKLRVVKQKQELEGKKNNENKLHGKLCQQVLELKRELQLRQTKLNMVEKEKAALKESLSQSENLQRQDQKSSYVLQMKIVELQEKLEASCRKNEELSETQRKTEARSQLLQDKLREMQGEWACLGKNTIETQSSVSEISKSYKSDNRYSENGCENNQKRSEDTLDSNSGKHFSVLDLEVNDVLREKVSELQHTFYNKGERLAERKMNDDRNISFFNDEFEREKWKQESSVQPQKTPKVLNEDVSNISSRKMEVVYTGDKRRSSSDYSSSSSTSSTSSSRRGSSESPKVERRQLKVLKVRKVSKENISQFQQNAAYITSLSRQQALRKDLREDPCGSPESMKSNHSSPNASPYTIKKRTYKL